MKKQILNELLDRYERSKAFREGESSKRVLVDVSSSSMFSSWMEQGDSKREFLESLEALRREGLINYSWERFEKGNLVDKVWLVTDEAASRKAILQQAGFPDKGNLLFLTDRFVQRCTRQVLIRMSLRTVT